MHTDIWYIFFRGYRLEPTAPITPRRGLNLTKHQLKEIKRLYVHVYCTQCIQLRVRTHTQTHIVYMHTSISIIVIFLLNLLTIILVHKK